MTIKKKDNKMEKEFDEVKCDCNKDMSYNELCEACKIEVQEPLK